jgi:tetratricopeptide (TPR) repeat protein
MSGPGKVASSVDVGRWKRRLKETPPELEPELLDQLAGVLREHRRESSDAATEYQLLWLLLPLARRTGKLPEFRRELDRALDLAAGRTDQLLALASLRADLETQEGRYDEAEKTLRSSLKISSEIDEARKGSLLLKLGRVLVHRERYEQAGELFAEVLPIFESGGHAALAASCRFHLGNIALRQGRFAAASSHHRQGLAVRKGLDDVHAVCASLCALGSVSLAAGNYPQALEWFTQAETEARRVDALADLAYALYGLGRTRARLGDFTGAAPLLRASLDIRHRIGDQEGQAISQIALAENVLNLGQPRKALEGAQEAVFHLSMLAPSGTVGDAERLLGRIALAQRKSAEARRHFQAALDHHGKHHDATAQAFDRAGLLRAAFEWPVREEVERLVDSLVEYLDGHPYPDLGERLDFAIYGGLQRLHAKGKRGGRIGRRLEYLERAYKSLMRKTGYLDADLRHRFLFQVPDNDAILKAAAENGIDQGA